MKASTLNDLGGKCEEKNQDQIVGPDPDRGPGMVSASLSDDGKSICLNENTVRMHRTGLPISKPIEIGNNPAARTLNFSSFKKCPCCGCIWVKIAGYEGYYDTTTKKPCRHH